MLSVSQEDGLKDALRSHVTHHSLALWALGAPKPLIDAAYERDLHMQRPAFESPEPITTDNFNDHLGDEKYVQAHFSFIIRVV